MTTSEQASLLGLPFELRSRIYDHVFEDHYVTIYLDDNYAYEKPAIDSGITLTNHQIRAETMLHLQKGIGIRCHMVRSDWQSPQPFHQGKASYPPLIHRIHLLFLGDNWELPFEMFANLKVLYAEADESCNPVGTRPQRSAAIVKRDVDAGIKDFITKMASIVLGNVPEKTRDMLNNSQRGFRVIWRDMYDCFLKPDPNHGHVRLGLPVTEHMLMATQTIRFDWDTLEVTEGLGELKKEFDLLSKEDEKAGDERNEGAEGEGQGGEGETGGDGNAGDMAD
jgi:hypothetical protein